MDRKYQEVKQWLEKTWLIITDSTTPSGSKHELL